MSWVSWSQTHILYTKKLTLWQLSQCHNSNHYFFANLLMSTITYHCDKCHTITLLHCKRITDTRQWAKLIFESVTLWQLSQCHILNIKLKGVWYEIFDALNMYMNILWPISQLYVICDIFEPNNWAQEKIGNVTVWQRSQCHTFNC